MLLLDETPNLLAAAAQQATTTAPADTAVVEGGALDVVQKTDSINHAVIDSVRNMNLGDLKAVVSGENTIFKDALSGLMDLTVAFIPKLLGCILVLWVGFKLIKLLKKALTKLLDRRNAESTLKGFLTSLVDVLMKVMLIIMAMDIIGIKATSFIAVLGAAGLAIGMALQGTLQNFAGGVIILLLRPFKVGDYIEVGSFKGYVKEIRIFHTLIRPFNGRIIIVPNSELATKSLINHTKDNVIRLDVVASVAYGTDLDKARQVIQSVIDNDPLILKDPMPKFCVSELNSSSVDYSLWLWTTVDDYWTVWMRIRENIYKAFADNGISIPFPQLDVHLDK
ncbi:MAG: mechanosensitive ion channel [Bacteroidales bacterium]|nr:mechanosensitive ion channel [Bacteroidales bacterium]MBR6330038.1 mechanosensitive ion channel [Bacteroidales bacterium]